MWRAVVTFLLVLAFSPMILESPSWGAGDRAYLLATASTGGTFYPVGVALGTLSKIKLEPDHGLSLTAITSAGSGENIHLLRDGEVGFAILQGLYGAWAWNGEGPYEKRGSQGYLRAVTLLWRNVEHFVVKKNLAPSGTLADLQGFAGKPFSIGIRNSGTEGSGRQILGRLGIDPDTFRLVHVGYSASAESLRNGTAVGMTTPAGVPVAAVTQAFAALGDELTVLDVTDEQLAKINGEYPLWSRYVIPAGTYPGQDREIRTIAQPNFLAVHEDLGDNDVYLLTKTIYENLAFLNGIHKATAAMSLESALEDLPLPLHPGALRFFREAGMDVPAALVVEGGKP